EFADASPTAWRLLSRRRGLARSTSCSPRSTAENFKFRPARLLRDAVLPLVPVDHDIPDERRRSRPQIADGGHETARASFGAAAAEPVPGRLTRVGTVEVRRGPQHGNAVEIHQP